jgi:muramoyltetrapeptide carboxypeptidase
MSNPIRVGIVAASSVVPVAEFNVGLLYLREQGFDVTVHPQVLTHHFTFAGEDEARAGALVDFAHDSRFDVIWMARGGYGASRLLPILDRLTRERGRPKKRKLLIGYSDVTVLHNFVQNNWGWATLHAPMPAASSFSRLKPEEWRAILACVRGERTQFAWQQTQLEYVTSQPERAIEAELVGGNLSLVACVVGTPHAFDVAGKILFLEDVGEKPYRIDRMMTQIVQSGALDKVAAVVLGDFTDCEDEADTCLKPPAPGEDPRVIFENSGERERVNLRKSYSLPEAMQEIFGTIGSQLQIPIVKGLPVGHGPNYSPLPLGARYRLTVDGRLSLLEWDWNKS